MKTTTTGFLVATILFLARTLFAQSPLSEINTDSLTLVSPENIPASGTFWIEGPQGLLPPYPCLPPQLQSAPTYALPDGEFLVDARNESDAAFSGSTALPDDGSPAQPFTPSPPDPPVVFSNAWYSQVIISNHPYVSLDATFVNPDGTTRATELPPGVMFPLTSTNVALPLSQWQPAGQTNPVAAQTFDISYNPLNPAGFFAFQLQEDTNADLAIVTPYTLTATNLQLLSDFGVTVTWMNSQPDDAPELDAIIIEDAEGHSYLMDSLVTTGASNSDSFELTTTNGISYILQPTPATNGIYLYLPTNNFQNPDLMTIPYYVIEDPSSAPIMEVALYDMTDPSNPQLLVDMTGDGCQTGTLEIPGLLLASGTRTLELQVIDTSYNLTVTDFTVTIASLIDVQFPILSIDDVGNGNRMMTGTAGSGIAILATTSATNGNWVLTEYDGPSGTQLQQVQVPVASTGGVLQYNDGGEPPGGYTNAWFEFTITIGSTNEQSQQSPLPLFGRPRQPPSIPATNRFRVYPTGPHYPAGEITCYDPHSLSTDSFNNQYAMTAMQTEATMQSFTCYPIDFPNGVWTAINPYGNIPTTSLYQYPWNWIAVNASLAYSNYTITVNGQDAVQTVGFPINNFFINGDGGTNGAGIALGVMGGSANDQVSIDTLKSWGFYKTNRGCGLALAVFACCQIGNGPMMQFVLRNSKINGQISPTVQQQLNIRPCFGLGWNGPKSNDWQIYDYIAWWAYYAAYLTPNNSFEYSFNDAMTQAQNQTSGNGYVGVVWSGCQGVNLGQTVP